jgi:hypothetical protein
MSNSPAWVHFLPSPGDPGHEDRGCDSRVRAVRNVLSIVALGGVSKNVESPTIRPPDSPSRAASTRG